MNKFVESAKKATSVSPVLDGRVKISTEDIIARYPDGFTVTEFDVIHSQNGAFPALAIKEDPEVYYFGGTVLMTIVSGWADQYAGDIETASAALTEAGGVRIKLRKTRTKAGNNLTVVDVLGE